MGKMKLLNVDIGNIGEWAIKHEIQRQLKRESARDEGKADKVADRLSQMKSFFVEIGYGSTLKKVKTILKKK